MIRNPGFESPDTSTVPGLALDWNESTFGAGEETAEFTGDSSVPFLSTETFEHGWGATDPQVLQLILPVTANLIERIGPESMERWLLNLQFIAFGAMASAQFDEGTQSLEDFESGWGEIDQSFELTAEELGSGGVDTFAWSPLVTTLTSTAAATFNTGSPTVERFDYVSGGNPATEWPEALT